MDEELPPEEEGKDEKSISSDLIRGHINTIILRALYDGDKYGYEIIAEIERKSHGQYSLKQPSLYSALKRLEKDGYVSSYWGGSVAGGRRKYFSLTDEGKLISEQNQSEWEYSRTVIDSLISDKDFDFGNPPPASVNMRVLKNSTSRVPSREGADDGLDYEPIFDDAPDLDRINAEIAEKNAEIANAKLALEEERRQFEEEKNAVLDAERMALEEEMKARGEAEKERLEREIEERERSLLAESERLEQLRLEQMQAENEQAHAREADRAEAEARMEERMQLLEKEETERRAALEAEEQERRRMLDEEEASRKAALDAEEQERTRILNEEEASKKAALDAEEQERRRILDEEEASRKAALDAEEASRKAALDAEEQERRRILDEEETSRKAALEAEETSRKAALDEEIASHKKALEDAEALRHAAEAQNADRIKFLEQEMRDREAYYNDERNRFADLLRRRDEQIEQERRAHSADLVEQEQRILREQEAVFRRREQELLHKNYLDLVSSPPQPAPDPKDYTYYTSPADRPAAPAPAGGKDYRDVVQRILSGTAQRQEEPAESLSIDGIDFHDLESRAAHDGIRITTTGSRLAQRNEEPALLVHKGKALFLSAIVVFLLCVVEGAITFAVRKQYGIPLFEPWFICLAGLALLLVTGLAYANHWGRRAIRGTTYRVLINAVVAFVLCIIITLIVALAAKIDFASSSDIAAYIVVPAIFFFGIVVFGICYYLLTRSGRKKD